jgi:TPR repeat protein
MKKLYFFCCMIFLALLLPTLVEAKTETGRLAQADRYYQQGEFKKAYKIYSKMAKAGDHYSQHRLAQMFARGEGMKADLVQAYAWAVLATEGGQDGVENYRDSLLQRVENKNDAQEKANKLKKKYGQEALGAKNARKTHPDRSITCTGSRLPC